MKAISLVKNKKSIAKKKGKRKNGLLSGTGKLKTRNKELSQSRNYSDAIVATLREPMLVLDENLYVKSANPSFYRVFNTSKQKTEGKSLFSLIKKQFDIPDLRVLLDDILSRRTDFTNYEATLTVPKKGKRILLLNSYLLTQKKNKERLILFVINDITDRSRNYLKEKALLKKDIRTHKADKADLEKAVMRRTRQLRQKNRELENVNKDLTSFTYVSSHDLQEPLRKIQNFVLCILLEEEANLSETGKRYFIRLRDTAARMQKLIEDLLKYSRTMKSELHFEEANLNALLNEVVKDFELAFQEKKAKINIEKLGTARVIPFQFRQLFQNLISNSLKFAKPGIPPQITIKSKFINGRTKPHTMLPGGKKYLNLIFTDNGIGFDPEYRERIFDVFQRLHSYDEYKGTGIGLAICKRIVENHNGLITAQGKPNKGTRFDTYLPLE